METHHVQNGSALQRLMSSVLPPTLLAQDEDGGGLDRILDSWRPSSAASATPSRRPVSGQGPAAFRLSSARPQPAAVGAGAVTDPPQRPRTEAPPTVLTMEEHVQPTGQPLVDMSKPPLQQAHDLYALLYRRITEVARHPALTPQDQQTHLGFLFEAANHLEFLSQQLEAQGTAGAADNRQVEDIQGGLAQAIQRFVHMHQDSISQEHGRWAYKTQVAQECSGIAMQTNSMNSMMRYGEMYRSANAQNFVGGGCGPGGMGGMGGGMWGGGMWGGGMWGGGMWGGGMIPGMMPGAYPYGGGGWPYGGGGYPYNYPGNGYFIPSSPIATPSTPLNTTVPPSTSVSAPAVDPATLRIFPGDYSKWVH